MNHLFEIEAHSVVYAEPQCVMVVLLPDMTIYRHVTMNPNRDMHRVLEGQGLRFHKRNFWTKIATTADVHIADIQGISYFWDAKPQLFIARGASKCYIYGLEKGRYLLFKGGLP